MAQSTVADPVSHAYPDESAEIHLEVRQGAGKAVSYELPQAGFLIGTVPGCDLRLPGSNLPPVICTVIRHEGGAELRRLAPMFPLTINGKQGTAPALKDGDRIGLGSAEIRVRVIGGTPFRAAATPASATVAPPARVPEPQPRHEHSELAERLAICLVRESELAKNQKTFAEHEARLAALAQQLAGERQQLQDLRASLSTRTAELDGVQQEYRKQSEVCDVLQQRLQQQERDMVARRADLDRRELAVVDTEKKQQHAHSELRARGDLLQRQKDELTLMGKQLTDIREQLHARYQAEKERLAKLRAAIRSGAKKLQQRKAQLELQGKEQLRRYTALLQREQAVEAAEQELAQRSLALSETEEQVAQNQAELTQVQADVERVRQQAQEQLKESAEQYRGKRDRLAAFHQALRRAARKLRVGKKRLEEECQGRVRALHEQATEMEHQGQQLEEWRIALEKEADNLAQGQHDQEALQAELRQRIAATETQQAALTALRTKLERGQETLHQQQMQLSEQHVDLQAREQALQNRVQELDRLGSELDQTRRSQESDRREFQERVGLIASAVGKLKQKQAALQQQEERPQTLDPVSQENDEIHQPDDVESTEDAAPQLAELRAWYQHRFRELADSHTEDPSRRSRGKTAGQRDILTLTGDADPADRKLGELMRSLGLIDDESLSAILIEARKQRRPLRQAILNNGCMTLYQLALVEAGNLDALTLGPVFAIDRLRQTDCETVYRVYDPRRNAEAVLRHLGEGAMTDPARPQEFRDCFAQACAMRHPNVAATLEVFDILDRPAVLLEPLSGLSAADWPELCGVPGVWYRLVCQAVLGLSSAHQAGVLHGHIEPSMILLTPEGTVKLSGFGEPSWLADAEGSEHQLSEQADLHALGQLAAKWAAPGQRKASKARAMPDEVRPLLRRLQSTSAAARFASAAELLDSLEQISEHLPANAAAWERLLKHVREHAVELAPLPKSA